MTGTARGEEWGVGGRRSPASAARRRVGPALVALSMVAAVLSSCSLGGPGHYQLTVYFTKTVSLYRSADVRVLGLKVGTVASVQTKGDQVQVKLSIDNGAVLPAGLRATIVPQSLLGARYVQLYPAWVDGQPRLNPGSADQQTIGVDRTSVPAEPNEALSALKRLLDTLDPNATGRLITNLNDDLRGNGQNINAAVHALSALTNTLADKDQQLGTLIDNLGQFTSVLETRETQLGQVMDLFAQTTSLLSAERSTIASLITNLARASTNALDLVNSHAVPLQSDLDNLARLVSTLDANLSNLSTLLSAGPALAGGPNLDGKGGLSAAYNPTYHRIDLRDNVGATVNGLLQALGLPLCLAIPLLGAIPQSCPGGTQLPSAAAAAAAAPAPAGQPARALGSAAGNSGTAALASPLSGVLNLLGSGGTSTPQLAAYGFIPPAQAKPRTGVAAGLSRWSRHLLEGLW